MELHHHPSHTPWCSSAQSHTACKVLNFPVWTRASSYWGGVHSVKKRNVTNIVELHELKTPMDLLHICHLLRQRLTFVGVSVKPGITYSGSMWIDPWWCVADARVELCWLICVFLQRSTRGKMDKQLNCHPEGVCYFIFDSRQLFEG